jgi:hypothetical protein
MRWQVSAITAKMHSGDPAAGQELAALVSTMSRTTAVQLERDIDEIRAGLKLFGPAAERVLSWLEEGFDGPLGAELSARRAFWADRRSELGL